MTVLEGNLRTVYLKMVFDGVVGCRLRDNLLILWSTGRELNPRILVLQTSALATSPPVLLSAVQGAAED